eukprot:GHUV01001000.1.p1 GENE.GHUV01001000.1~~GHUV01001000.1.p1  ORF type:complete len:509 (+),score=134.97 GHUV01001000.1:162-1688(+)
MSPCCVVLSSSVVGPAPLPQVRQLEANSLLLAALASLKGAACQSAALTESGEDGSGFFAPLIELSSSPLVTSGSVSELALYKDWVKSKVHAAAELASESRVWRESGVVQKLQRAMALVDAGSVNKGREAACEVLGFRQLKSVATSSLQLTCNPTVSAGFDSSSARGPSSAGSVTAAFKVPALPAKRSRQQLEQQQSSPWFSRQTFKQPEVSSEQPQQRKHSAPKRRATPQVLPAAPFVLGSAAAPDSASHGEACCDENLLSCWCPISGKRQRALPVDPSSTKAYSNSSELPPLQRQDSPPGFNISSSAATSTAAVGVGMPPKLPAATALPAAAGAGGSGGLSAAAVIEVKASASSRLASHVEAVQSLKRLLHEDPTYRRPSSDVLLFKKAHQQPVHNWTGVIKHRSAGTVVDLCKVTLQVPEPFLEEFPAVLYAAEVRHRRSVSLGRHVVCRATLGTVNEHQLAGLSAMARGQLVAVCMLQTAELHLVPYFDNKNLVRMVGFLKIKSE